ncbi:MAG: hypothetical protein PHH90_10455 [Limnochordia bacterium]|nr:hypothetical protein [Limnochordia bacterium]
MHISRYVDLLTEKYGFTQLEHVIEPNIFGNVYYLFEREEVLLKITRDRGQFFTEICSKQDIDNWYELHFFIDIIDPHFLSSDIELKEAEVEKINLYVDIIDGYLHEILRYCRPDKYIDIQPLLSAERKKRLIAKSGSCRSLNPVHPDQ